MSTRADGPPAHVAAQRRARRGAEKSAETRLGDRCQHRAAYEVIERGRTIALWVVIAVSLIVWLTMAIQL